MKKPIPVLMYHRLNQTDPTSSLVISPETFTRQIDWLERKRFRFLSLDEVMDRAGRISLWDRAVAFTFDDGFRDTYENGFSRLLRRKKTAALFVVVDWVGRDGFLSWQEIRGLADLGITIGSHSLSHRWLPDVRDDEELEREVCDSKKKIEDEIGREVKHFCYPVGGVDERVAGVVKKAGYGAAWIAAATPTNAIKDLHLRLRRIKISPSDANLIRFAVKVSGIKGLFTER